QSGRLRHPRARGGFRDADRRQLLQRGRAPARRDARAPRRPRRGRGLAVSHDVAAALEAVRARIASACARAGRELSTVRLVAVSKAHPPSALRAAHAAGQRVFGESYVQELVEKAAALSDELTDVELHFIGRLQTNKVKALVSVPALACVESVDSA